LLCIYRFGHVVEFNLKKKKENQKGIIIQEKIKVKLVFSVEIKEMRETTT